LLVSLLNEANEEVLKAHESPAGQVLLGGQDVLPFSAATDKFKSKEGLLASDILEEPIGEGPEATNEEDFETEVEFSLVQPNAIKQLKKVYKQQTQDIQEAFKQEELTLALDKQTSTLV
jgi:hypothetical protein